MVAGGIRSTPVFLAADWLWSGQEAHLSPEPPDPTTTPTGRPVRWPLVFVGLIPGALLLGLIRDGTLDDFEIAGYAYLADLVLGLLALTRRGYRWIGVGLLLGVIPAVLGLALLFTFLAACTRPGAACIAF